MLLYADSSGKEYVCLPEYKDLGFDSSRAYELKDHRIGLTSVEVSTLQLKKEVTMDELYAQLNS